MLDCLCNLLESDVNLSDVMTTCCQLDGTSWA